MAQRLAGIEINLAKTTQFDDKLISQFRELIEIQKKQQDQMTAITAWIQEHVEAQESKKKATPAKK